MHSTLRVLAATSIVASVILGAVSTGDAADEITLAVEPAVDLVDGQTVTIVGTGPPNEQVFVGQCRAETFDCDVISPNSTLIITRTEGNGKIRIETRVRARLNTDNGVVDCTAPTETCVLRVGIGSPAVGDELPLTFRGQVRTPRPSMTG